MHGGGGGAGGHGGGFGGGHGGHGGHGAIGGHHHAAPGDGSGGGAVPPVIGRRSPRGAGAVGDGLAAPSSVVLATWWYFASAVLVAVGGVLGQLSALRVAHALAVRGQAVGVTLGITTLVVLALKLLVVVRLRRGRNWSRIAVVVIAVFEAVDYGVRADSLGRQLAVGPLSAGAVLAAVLGLVALVAAVVLLFRPESNTFFRSRR